MRLVSNERPMTLRDRIEALNLTAYSGLTDEQRQLIRAMFEERAAKNAEIQTEWRKEFK